MASEVGGDRICRIKNRPFWLHERPKPEGGKIGKVGKG